MYMIPDTYISYNRATCIRYHILYINVQLTICIGMYLSLSIRSFIIITRKVIDTCICYVSAYGAFNLTK